MATDLNQIQALNDFPETPYQSSEEGIAARIRWIHAQCFQIELPNKKVIMTDPFFPQHPRAWKRENTPTLDLNAIGRVDYVTINHSHFDHNASLPDVFSNHNPIVICDSIFARELSAAYQIPEYQIFPIVAGMSYHFDDFDLDTVHGRHNDIGSVCELDGGPMADPNNAAFGPLNSYGCMFNTSFLFTLTNHFRIGFAAGVDVDRMADAWKKNGPDLLLRQRLVYARPEEYAKDCLALGGQMVMPMHHDASFEWNADMNAFSNEVNGIFHKAGSFMRMFNPERLKWYTIRLGIRVE